MTLFVKIRNLLILDFEQRGHRSLFQRNFNQISDQRLLFPFSLFLVQLLTITTDAEARTIMGFISMLAQSGLFATAFPYLTSIAIFTKAFCEMLPVFMYTYNFHCFRF